MGSELVSLTLTPPLEGVRGGRVGVGGEEGLRGVPGGPGGAIVSCSALRSLESMVGATLRSRDAPQVEQNRPVEETCEPHEEQYMGGEILPLPEGSLRMDAIAPGENYEMRSTCTAVP
jgi:hypothetical protein